MRMRMNLHADTYKSTCRCIWSYMQMRMNLHADAYDLTPNNRVMVWYVSPCITLYLQRSTNTRTHTRDGDAVCAGARGLPPGVNLAEVCASVSSFTSNTSKPAHVHMYVNTCTNTSVYMQEEKFGEFIMHVYAYIHLPVHVDLIMNHKILIYYYCII